MSQAWQPLVGWVADWPVLLSFLAERSLPDLTPTALPQTLFDVSPSLASLVNLHEPEFIKFEADSFEYHRHLAGLGASGLEVNPVTHLARRPGGGGTQTTLART